MNWEADTELASVKGQLADAQNKLAKLIAERDHYQKSNTTQGRKFGEEYAKREALEAKVDNLEETNAQLRHMIAALEAKCEPLKSALKECAVALKVVSDCEYCDRDLTETIREKRVAPALARAKEALK